MSEGVTRTLAEFCARLRFEDLPSEIVHEANAFKKGLQRLGAQSRPYPLYKFGVFDAERRRIGRQSATHA